MTLDTAADAGLTGALRVARWQIGDRNSRAWLWSIGARLGLIVWSDFGSATALVPIAATFLIIDGRNSRKWRKERALSERVAESSRPLPDSGRGATA